MKKSTIIICLMFIAVTLNAQKSIYIRPLTAIKFNNSFYERGRFFNSNSPLDFAGNDYYSLYNYGLHANTSQLNIGLGIGINGVALMGFLGKISNNRGKGAAFYEIMVKV